MRIRLDLAYDGTEFHGWAVQPNLRTVQGELQAALATALRLPEVTLFVAGRTDTGVHARGQVAHVDVEEADLAALLRKLNGILPVDVRIHRLTPVTEDFHARFSALTRRYVYRVADSPDVADPLLRGHVLFWPHALDLGRMNLAAAQLLGLHDFGSFCKAREGATTIRTLLALDWARAANGLAEMTVVADAFCHSMVRCLVGCLLAIGDGRADVAWAKELLDEASRVDHRGRAPIVAPANGLTLEEVVYPPDEELASRSFTTMARRVNLRG